MIRPVRFPMLSISVWTTLLLLVISFGHALNEDDQDGGPPSHRSNSSQSSGLLMNQAGRLPISNNNNPSAFFRQQTPQQFGGLPFQQSGIGFPFNGAAGGFQQNGFPQLNSFQQSGIPQQSGFQQSSFPLNSFSQNGFQQPAFQQSSLPQNSFLQNGFQQSSFPQNSFQQTLPQQQNGALLGQGSQFNSLGLQNQLVGAQLGLQNQFSGNNFQNQLGIQNQLGFSQNPFGLGLLQQQNQLGLQNQFGLSNQLGIQNQMGVQNPFLLQNQLGLQNQLKGQQQSPFSFSQQLGGSSGFSNDPQLGFGQSSFGNFPQNNGGSQFGGAGFGTGSTSSLGSNQILLQGGQFQDSSSPSGLQFGSQTRFPFGTSSLTNNRFPSNSQAGLGESQFGSQLFTNNQFNNRDPFMSQRPQLQSSLDTRQQNRLGRDGEFFPNERALSFNNTFDGTSQFQSLQQQQPQQQPPINPFLSQQFLGSFNNQQPFAGGNPLPLSFNQEQLRPQQFNPFPSTLNQQQSQNQQQLGPFGTLPSFSDRPPMQFNNAPFNNNQQDFGPNQSLMGTSGNTLSEQQQIRQPQKPQQAQSLPLPIPMTGFSCEGRPPGYYADMKNECRTFHICIDDGSTTGLKRSFACPNGTLFDQVNSVCQWKDDMDCSRSQLFFPRPAASTTASIKSNSGDIRPTSSPFNTQIQSPPRNNFADSTPPTSFLHFGVGQPSPSHGSLDAGRSLDDTRRNADISPIRSRSTLYTPPQIRPPLFRPSEQLDDRRKA